jgi:biopolymer transport protein ExbB/TolQ
MAATITVVCPNCHNKMRASAEHIGRQGRCPSCKRLVEIASSAEESLRPTLAPVSGARRPDQRAAGTQVNPWLAGLFGAAATALLYGAVFWPLRHTYLGQLMLNRGPIQYCITLVTCWGISILVLRYLAVQRELANAELELELIPLEIGLQVTPDNVDQFLEHLAKLPPAQQQSILTRRIQGALQHFKHRTSVPEVQGYLSSQAEIEASAVDSGYTLLRAFIWVCPILGFIGTVTGISDGVTGLQGVLQNLSGGAPEGNFGEQMLKGMGMVTSGLAVAFDTTLLGLVCVIILMFPCETLRKTEYAMLDRVEEFANESLLRRMAEGPGAAADGELPEIVRRALESAFKEHQRWLAQWQTQVGQLGQAIGADFEAAVGNGQERWTRSEAARLDKIEGASRLVEEMFQKVVQTTRSWQESGTGDFQVLLRTAEQLNEVLSQQKQAAEKYAAGDLGEALRGIQQVLAQLADRLAAPGPAANLAPVTVSEAPRGGLFGRILGRNSR